MKPLGTNNAVENILTTPKSAFGKPISQCGLSTKSLKPRGTQNAGENGLTTPKSSFRQTGLPSWLSTSKSVSETEDPNRTGNQSDFHKQKTKN
ncbi:hypothetical protein C4G41_RS22975 [Vibrio parahaemolyticus]|nr:hypothetical protein [Vibrio parahaemolyticus]EJG0800597.1 hypothetical protein [Vibrio parahaemolyticus]